MKCDKCGKYNATTHIKQVVNGVVYETNLCHYCAKSETADNGFSGILASLLGESLSKPAQAAKRCSLCNSSFNDIAHSGKAGCPECYKTFKQELLPYLKRVHGSTKHQGSTPSCEKWGKNTLEELRDELARLVAEERYEQAAVIRDKIKEAEAKKYE